MKSKIAPLPATTLLLGMFGFLFAVFVLSKWSLNFAWVVGIFSAILFIASMISTTYGPADEEMALDKPSNKRGDSVRVMSRDEYEASKQKKPSVKSVTKKSTKKTSTKTSKKATVKKTTKKAPKRKIK